VLLVLTLLVMALGVWLTAAGEPLNTEAAPQGIVSFEFAWSHDRSAEILDSWDASALAAAMFVQGLDALYLLAYPAWFSLAALRIGRRLGGAWSRRGLVVSWLVLLSAPLDTIENYALVRQLVEGPSQFYAQLAAWCALPKFALVAVAASFLAMAAVVWSVARVRGERS